MGLSLGNIDGNRPFVWVTRRVICVARVIQRTVIVVIHRIICVFLMLAAIWFRYSKRRTAANRARFSLGSGILLTEIPLGNAMFIFARLRIFQRSFGDSNPLILTRYTHFLPSFCRMLASSRLRRTRRRAGEVVVCGLMR